jgi:hypothetical protein
LVIANTIVLNSVTSPPILSVVFVAMLATWLVIVQTEHGVRMHEIVFQEVPHNVALVEAMQSTESMRTSCQSLQATLLAMARLAVSKLVQVCTTKAIITAVLVGVPNRGSVSLQVPQHHGNDKTVAATIMEAKTKAAQLHHGPQLLVDMELLLAQVRLPGSKLHRLEVTITAIRAMLRLVMI